MCQLWLQEKVRRNEIKVKKVGTEENLADALTKYVSREVMSRHISETGQGARKGRHSLAPATEY